VVVGFVCMLNDISVCALSSARLISRLDTASCWRRSENQTDILATAVDTVIII